MATTVISVALSTNVAAAPTTMIAATRRVNQLRRLGARSGICSPSGRVGGFSQELYAAEEISLFRRLKRETRRRGRRVVILHRHPLVTSGRKAHLYTVADALRFYGRVILTGGRALRSAEGSFVWYDGRR